MLETRRFDDAEAFLDLAGPFLRAREPEHMLTLGSSATIRQLGGRVTGGALVAVLRRGGPRILEASVAPAVLFYVCLVFGSLGLAYLTAIGWLYGCVARCVVRRQPVPQILVLSAIGISM